MTTPDLQTPDKADTKVSHIGIVPAQKRYNYSGEEVQDWIEAGWTFAALIGLVALVPLSVALGLPLYNALLVYALVNVAALFAWFVGLDAATTNLLYGRRTPCAPRAATGARRMISVSIQVAMTIAAVEMLVLAGFGATTEIPRDVPHAARQVQAAGRHQ